MRRLPRVQPSTVIALLALFVALGGTGYAALKLPKNSVKSSTIKNGQVKRADIAGNAVDSSKVKDGSLLSADFAAGQLPAGPQGPKGDTGATGATGAKGDQGIPGPTASGFAQNSTGAALNFTPTILNQADITTTTTSRIIAQASVDVHSTTAANVYCFITTDPAMSSPNDWSVRTNDDFTGDQNTGVIGAKVLPAGTYTVYVACGKNTGTVNYVESDLALIAAAS